MSKKGNTVYLVTFIVLTIYSHYNFVCFLTQCGFSVFSRPLSPKYLFRLKFLSPCKLLVSATFLRQGVPHFGFMLHVESAPSVFFLMQFQVTFLFKVIQVVGGCSEQLFHIWFLHISSYFYAFWCISSVVLTCCLWVQGCSKKCTILLFDEECSSTWTS